jgi:hypothetical protein
MVSRSGDRSRAFLALRFFFVGMAFPARRRAGTDDSNLIAIRTVRNHKQATALGAADQDPSRLAARVRRIGNCDRERIGKCRASLAKDTPCLRRFDTSFRGSQVKLRGMQSVYSDETQYACA